METVGGEGDQLAHYLKVVADKTGSLISTSARFGAMIGGASPQEVETLTIFGEQIGVAFQLADDVIDIASESGISGKTPGTDLREGVPTLVTLHVMASTNPADSHLKSLLSKPIEDEKIVKEVLAALRVHPALEFSRNRLHEYSNGAKGSLDSLPDSPAKAALVSLCDAIIERSA
jgi:heptaprenyl diphosphate synthase